MNCHWLPARNSTLHCATCDKYKDSLDTSTICGLNMSPNEQKGHIMTEPETKECGLEDENAGETLSDRPLVVTICPSCLHWDGPPAENPPWSHSCFRCKTPFV